MAAVANAVDRRADRWERTALASGLVFGVLQIISLAFSFLVVVPTHAPIGAGAVETSAALAREAGNIALGTYLLVLPSPFLILFTAGLYSVLARAAAGGTVPAVAAVLASVMWVSVLPLGGVLSGLSAPVALQGGDPAVVKELDSITPLAMALVGLPQALLVTVVSLVAMGSRLIPRWFGWAGVMFALFSFAAAGTIASRDLFPVALLSNLLFPLWALGIAGSMLRSGATDE